MVLETWNLVRLMADDGEHSGLGSVEISQIFAVQDHFFVVDGLILFHGVHKAYSRSHMWKCHDAVPTDRNIQNILILYRNVSSIA